MNRNELTPDDGGTSELNESKIIGSFLFKTYKELAKAIEKKVSDFDTPRKTAHGCTDDGKDGLDAVCCNTRNGVQLCDPRFIAVGHGEGNLRCSS